MGWILGEDAVVPSQPGATLVEHAFESLVVLEHRLPSLSLEQHERQSVFHKKEPALPLFLQRKTGAKPFMDSCLVVRLSITQG